MVRVAPSTIAKGVGVYFAAAVGGYLYLRSAKAPAPSPCGCGGKHGSQQGRADDPAAEASEQETFDRLADYYDSCINLDETVMGIKLMRRWLVRQAEGDVLEVSAGTGRNLPYYNHTRLRSLTLTDTSRAMLVNAADKHAAQVAPGADAAHVRFELADAQHLTSLASSSNNSSGGSDRNLSSAPLADIAALQGQEESEVQQDEQVAPAPASAAAAAATVRRPPLRQQRTFPPHSFDVVVDTFGLCSQRDPVTALKEMARVCKPGGRILLLQHGKAKASWLNRVLDDGAREHHSKWGCWWNRDIEQIVRQAGLEVDSMSRWHFGTTYLLVARPTAAAAPVGSSVHQLKAPG